MWELRGSRLLVVAWLVLLPALLVSGVPPCPSQQSGRDEIVIKVSSGNSCTLVPPEALAGLVEADTKLLLKGTPYTAAKGASTAILEPEGPPVFEGIVSCPFAPLQYCCMVQQQQQIALCCSLATHHRFAHRHAHYSQAIHRTASMCMQQNTYCLVLLQRLLGR
jgi:hypothetical protein